MRKIKPRLIKKTFKMKNKIISIFQDIRQQQVKIFSLFVKYSLTGHNLNDEPLENNSNPIDDMIKLYEFLHDNE